MACATFHYFVEFSLSSKGVVRTPSKYLYGLIWSTYHFVLLLLILPILHEHSITIIYTKPTANFIWFSSLLNMWWWNYQIFGGLIFWSDSLIFFMDTAFAAVKSYPLNFMLAILCTSVCPASLVTVSHCFQKNWPGQFWIGCAELVSEG